MECKIPVPWGFIAGKTYGSWSGTPVLAIHDWLENSSNFSLIGPKISKEIFFLAIDLPGHGKSSHLPAGISYHRVDFAHILKRVIDHQRWKKVSIVGHGEGAELAIFFVAAFPTIIDKVILIDRVKPPSVSYVDRSKSLALAIDQIVENDENYSTKTNETFQITDEINKICERSNWKLSEELAKLILERESCQSKNTEEEWIFTKDTIRLNTPDTILPSHEQALNIVTGFKGIHVAIVKSKDFLKGLHNEDEIQKSKESIEILKKITKTFKEIEMDDEEVGHFGCLTHPEKFAKIFNEFILSY